ncbi:EpsG family protein [Enterobacter ludwigii]
MIYFALLGALFLFSLSDLSPRKNHSESLLNAYLYFIVFIILVCFAGLRFDTGWDYKGYHHYYDMIPPLESIPSHLDVFNSIYFEPGFKVLMALSKTFGLSFYSFQFLVSCITMCIIHRAISTEKAKLLFLFLYFATCYLFLNMSFIRQGLAIAFLYLSVSMLFQGCKKTAIFYLLFGCLFHLSLIFILPVIVVANSNKLSNRILYLFVVVAITVYLVQLEWLRLAFKSVSFIFPSGLSYKVSTYLDSDKYGRSRDIGFGIVEKLTTFFIMIHIYNKQPNMRNKILLRFVVFYMITYFAFYEITILYDRLRLYFVALNVFVYLQFYYYFKGVNKGAVYAILILYCFFSYSNIFRSDFNRVVFIPYNSVLNDENSISPEFKGDFRVDRAGAMDR